jgi:hypothetical protein
MDYDLVHRARRASVGTNVLDLGAWIGLAAGAVFWSNFFWLMVGPSGIPEMVYSVAMAVAYAFVLPILLSTLVPSTPAGQLLQQTRWKTVGFGVTIAAVVYLCFHAFVVLVAYWQSRPTVAETGQDRFLAVGSLIVFVLVPALAWVQAAPDRWMAEVQAAQAVRRLKLAQEANIMAMKTQYIRQISLLRRGIANLTAAEADEVAGTLIMFQRAENEAMGQIVDSLETITGVSTGVNLVGDQELERAYTGITTKLRGLIVAPNEADYVEASRPRASMDDADASVDVARLNASWQPSIPQHNAETVARGRVHGRSRTTPATVRHGPPRTTDASMDDAAYVAAREALTGAWSRSDLEKALSIQKSKASDLIRAWRGLGLIDDITNPAHHYAWRER